MYVMVTTISVVVYIKPLLNPNLYIPVFVVELHMLMADVVSC